MKIHTKHWGIPLVVIGALVLIVGFIAGWTNVNALLICALLLIVAGIVMYILTMKREDKY